MSQLHIVVAVLSLVLPGLIYVHYGRRVLRTDWIAVRTAHLVAPFILFLLLMAASGYLYDAEEKSLGHDGLPPPRALASSPIDEILFLLTFPVWAMVFYYYFSLGQILVFGARRDVVVEAVRVILGQLGWGYEAQGDRFIMRSMGITVNWTERGGLVGIRWWTWDVRRVVRFRRAVMRTFTGRPGEGSRPGLLRFGIALVVLGSVLGAVLAVV